MAEDPRLNPDPEVPPLNLDDAAPSTLRVGAASVPPGDSSRRDIGTGGALPATSPGYGGYGASGYGQETGEQLHLTDYFRVLFKRRWTIAASFTIVLGFVTLHTFTVTPVFRATTQLLIENENPNVINFQEVLQQNQRNNDYYQTQYRVLRSRLLARRTLDSAALWKHPLMAGSGEGGGLSLNPMAWASATVAMVSGWFRSDAVQELPAQAETAVQSRTIDRFLRGVSVEPIRNSRLVDISYASSNPEFAMQAVNALAKAYIEQNLDFRFSATNDAAKYLNQQVTEQRKAVDQSEEALQRYREQTNSQLLEVEDRGNIVLKRLADLNVAVTQASNDRAQKEAVYDQIRAVQNDPAALDTVPAVLSNSYVQGLKTQLAQLQREQVQKAQTLGEKHPDMVETVSAIKETETKLRLEVAKVVQALRNDYEAAKTLEQSLTDSLNRQKSEALSTSRQSIEYQVLERDAESNRQIFDGLLRRTRETGISSELLASNIRIVDAAEVPRRPTSPNKPFNLLMGAFGGLALGLGLAIFFEYLDNRIKLPAEIKTHLGLPFLGLVPAIDIRSLASAPLVNQGVPANFGEAFRTIRTNILFSSADSGSKSIVVTSTSPGEGKTLVSTNLAVSLAMASQRVLLIDADMRRPKVHEAFEMAHEPGLSNVLVNETKMSQAVRKTSIPSLWVLPAGKHPPNPAELLGSRRFKDVLTALGEHFEWVIVDSPPVQAVTDACVVAHVASGVVFVVGAEMTGRSAAKAALDQLDSAKAKHVGAILNRVDLRRHGYYYSHYYQRQYARYYTGA